MNGVPLAPASKSAASPRKMRSPATWQPKRRYKRSIRRKLNRKMSILSWLPRPRPTCFFLRPPVSCRKRSARKTPPVSMFPPPAPIFFMPGGGSRCPITRDNVDMNLATIHMTGKDVYKQAVTAMVKASRKVLADAGLTADDIACVIPHQANLRIIEAIADRLEIPLDRFYVNLDKYGNTSAAAVGIALDEANRSGRIKHGDYVLMA